MPSGSSFHCLLQNIFCLRPEQSHSIGVQVALGDTDATNIVIYASSVGDNGLRLLATRITPSPVSLPRSDDPIPRKPPLLLHAKCRDIFPPKPHSKVPAAPAKTEEEAVSCGARCWADRREDEQRCSCFCSCCFSSVSDIRQTVKRIVVRSISTHLLPKTHPEYKEVVNRIYRGVCFAMVITRRAFLRT